jgi:hypothetical protein
MRVVHKGDVNRTLRAMHQISRGLYEIVHHTANSIAAALLVNDPDDRIDIAAVRGIINQIGDGDGPVHECIFCGCGFDKRAWPSRFVILRPTVDALLAASKARGELPIMVLAICRACDALPDVKRRVLAKLKADIFHDIRELPPRSEAGHA